METDSSLQHKIVRQKITGINNYGQFADFVGEYFGSEKAYFCWRLKKECIYTKREDLLENPDYLRVLARTTIMAAEGGFESLDEYVVRHTRHGFVKSFSDISHTIATAGNLAKETVHKYEQTEALIAELNSRDGVDEYRDWALRYGYFKRINGKPQIPDYEQFSRGYRETGLSLPTPQRAKKVLPLMDADISFHQAVKGIGLTSEMADTLTEAELVPFYKEASVVFSPFANVQNVVALKAT